MSNNKEILDSEVEMYVLGYQRGQKSQLKKILQFIYSTWDECICAAKAETGDAYPCVNCRSAQFWVEKIKGEFSE